MIQNIECITTGNWKENCYVLSSSTGAAAIIDPGADFERIDSYLVRHQLKPLLIINTHAHYDHIGSVAPLKKKYGVPFLLHPSDEKLMTQANFYRNVFGGKENIEVPVIDRYFLTHESSHESMFERVEYNEFHFQIIPAPGHTAGGVCLLIEGHLFTGDTLYRGKVGSTILPGGNKAALLKTLQSLSKLDPQIKIYPGHGKASTIEEELKNNQEWIEILQNTKVSS